MAWQNTSSIPGIGTSALPTISPQQAHNRTALINQAAQNAPQAPHNREDEPGVEITVNPQDTSNPYHVSASENPSQTLVSILLNGNNYYPWERAMRMALLTKNNLEFVNGEIKRPEKRERSFPAWRRANNLVLSWILHSVIPSVAQGVLWMETAEEVWNDLKKRYGQGDAFIIADINEEIYHLMQGGNTVSEFNS
ncbi:PREDICTED: uncharacterized protein LOC109148618 [Ipomoea nil]|uniref:uncharacterized protein LOC109148618 n=1 Tax=Ipomoea nil TaxID=35883 RepID=UPI0009011624|nr:PREDICTED: uncharacterized protein LOC109148618 [Ipomoea nil]